MDQDCKKIQHQTKFAKNNIQILSNLTVNEIEKNMRFEYLFYFEFFEL